MGIRDSLYCTMYWRFCQVVFLNDLLFFEISGRFFITLWKKNERSSINSQHSRHFDRLSDEAGRIPNNVGNDYFETSEKALRRLTFVHFSQEKFSTLIDNFFGFSRGSLWKTLWKLCKTLIFNEFFPKLFPRSCGKPCQVLFLNFFFW